MVITETEQNFMVLPKPNIIFICNRIKNCIEIVFTENYIKQTELTIYTESQKITICGYFSKKDFLFPYADILGSLVYNLQKRVNK
jgi:hypothetical protein